MNFKRLLQIPRLIIKLNKRTYYSSNFKKLYLNKINEYISEISKTGDATNFKSLLDEYQKVTSNIADVIKETCPENKLDEELMTLMNEEKNKLELDKNQVIDRIFDEIYENEQLKDIGQIYTGNSDCIFEISAGVGGKEAMLFADELCNMYHNYFSYKNWQIESEERDTDGMYLRHYKATVKGQFVWDHLRYEIGVHRVQRIPKTESKGRIHTSTVTLACIPITKTHSIELNEKDLKIETKKASGAGGQHVNTTESAVRITHLPSSVSVECQEGRSQIKNREIAMKKLKDILADKQIKDTFDRYLKTRKSQVGQANRNEKIRTYNFNQDRVTDHRLSGSQNESNATIHDLESFFTDPMRIDNFIDALRQHDKERELIAVLEKL